MVEETHRFATLGFQLQGVDFAVETAVEDPEVSKRERSVTEALVQSWSPDWKGIPAPGAGVGAMLEVSNALERRKYASPMRLNRATIPNLQPLLNSKNPSRVAITIFLMAGLAHSTVLDNIISHLGTDLAPLLTLLGEKPTVQYLSQSLSPIDNVIFALAPVGVITAIVAAIRVGGDLGLRSFIGRALESRSSVEAELMSSTSPDVCEIWDGQAVIRVLANKSPILLQLIYRPQKIVSGNLEIYTLSEAVEGKIYVKEGGQGGDGEKNPVLSHPPNLLASLSLVHRSGGKLWVFSVVGTVLQASVLVLAALIQYRIISVAGDPIPVYALYVLLSGTIFLAIGMFLCAQVIERSTEEISWGPDTTKQSAEETSKKSTSPKRSAKEEPVEPTLVSENRVIWLQHGGQNVGGQVSESFAMLSGELAIMKSTFKGNPTSLRTRNGRVWAALILSLVGFATQFVGFRSTHSYVTLAQLLVNVIMVGMRSYAHMGPLPTNGIKKSENLGDGHELDWLAKELKGCSQWMAVAGLSNLQYSNKPPEVKSSDAKPSETKASEASPNMATTVMKTRARLAELSSSWKPENRKKVVSLKNAIEKTMNHVYTEMSVEPGYERLERFEWSLTVQIKSKKESPEKLSEVKLALKRKMDEGVPTAWETDEHDLEAALCLWIFFLRQEMLPKETTKEPGKEPSKKPDEKLPRRVRLLGKTTDRYAKDDYDLWIDRGTMLNSELEKLEGDIYFGWVGDNGQENHILNVNSEEDVETLCAQEIYTSFMFRLASIVGVIQGETAPRMSNFMTGNSSKSNPPGGSRSFSLFNTDLASLADLFSSSGLGSIENAYLCIVPALRASDKLPVESKTLTEIRNIWDAGDDINSVLSTPEGCELFGTISGYGSYKFVEWLLLAGAEPNNPPGGTPGRTGLQAAAEAGRNEVVKLLLDYKADFNAKPVEVSGRTAMQAAAGGGHKRIIELLFDKGASVNELPAKISGRTAMQAAAEGGYYEVVKWLMSEGADVKEEPAEELGRTAMQAAAGGGHKRIVELLFDKGATVNEPATISGRTAMQAAAEGGHYGVVRWLLEKEANANEKPAEGEGCTALHAAVKKNHVRVVQLLLEKGAKIDLHLEKRQTLLTALRAGHTEVVKLLVQKGADIELSTLEGADSELLARTLCDVGLDAAAKEGNEKIVRFLLVSGKGKSISVQDCGSALQAAKSAGHENIVRLLKEGVKLKVIAKADALTTTQAPSTAEAGASPPPPSSLSLSRESGIYGTIKGGVQRVQKIIFRSKEPTSQVPTSSATQNPEEHKALQPVEEGSEKGKGHDNTNASTSEPEVGGGSALTSASTSADSSGLIQETVKVPKDGSAAPKTAIKVVSSPLAANAAADSSLDLRDLPAGSYEETHPSSSNTGGANAHPRDEQEKPQSESNGGHGGSHSPSNSGSSASSPPEEKDGPIESQPAGEADCKEAHLLSSNAEPNVSSPPVVEGGPTMPQTTIQGDDKDIDSPPSDVGLDVDPPLGTVEEQKRPEIEVKGDDDSLNSGSVPTSSGAEETPETIRKAQSQS